MKFTLATIVSCLTATNAFLSPLSPTQLASIRRIQDVDSSVVSSSSALFSTTVPNGVRSTTTTTKDMTVAAVPMVAQRWRKSTKQVATLGPASSNKEMIEKLFLAGADVFRLNFSHGSQEQKKELLQIIREVEEKYSHPIGILGDLQGPKLRVRIYDDDDKH